VHDAGKEVTAGIANVNRWYGQLQDLLAAEAYKGLRMKTLLPQRHPSGDPNSLQLTREGFKTARVLGWYDPKLNRSTEKDAG
jgi:hypothetical protein